MPRYLLDCEFSGAGFLGTQAQPELRTVQGELMRAASLMAGSATVVRPTSRLDRGVDARHLPCDVWFDRTWSPRALAHAFNQHLPDDLCVRRVALVADDFNAIHQAVAKMYRYRVCIRGAPLTRDRSAWWLCRPLDGAVLHHLARLIVGERNLGSFSCLRHLESDHTDPVRTIFSAAWHEEPDDGDQQWTFTIRGDGFLYKQVRALVGAMVWAAGENGDPTVFAAAVDGGRAYRRPGDIAPPQGLCLSAVEFASEPDWIWA